MRIAVPSRHGRLLALCGLSAALHLLLLDLAARHGAELRTIHAEVVPLRVRLAKPAPAVAVAVAQAAIAAAAPAAPVAPAPMPDPDAFPTAEPGPAPAAPANRPAPDAAIAASGDALGEPRPFGPQSMQLHYQTRPPESAHLVYRIDEAGPAGAGAAGAFLDWHSEGDAYALDMAGVLGERSARGTVGDEGIVPARAQERSAGRTLETAFDPAQGRLVLPGGGAAPAQAGTLDGATLWIWLASIGNGAAGQLTHGISVNVADADGVHLVRFDVVGEEDVETGLGQLRAWHLAQYARPGETRVDAWLAPAQDWLPVRMRVTRADGSVATQVLQRRETAGAP
jgi:hypothetical protein